MKRKREKNLKNRMEITLKKMTSLDPRHPSFIA